MYEKITKTFAIHVFANGNENFELEFVVFLVR